MFDKDSGKVVSFVMVCKLYIRMKMMKNINILVDLESENWEFLLTKTKKLLTVLKREFGRDDDKLVLHTIWTYLIYLILS